jgi:hypothetical protein
MANLHKLTVQEAMNASGAGGVWDIQTVVTHGGTATTDTEHFDASSYHQLGIYAAGDIYFRFSIDNTVANGDCNTSNDLKIDSATLTFITVPRGLGKTIYFNHLGVSAVAVRIVGV